MNIKRASFLIAVLIVMSLICPTIAIAATETGAAMPANTLNLQIWPEFEGPHVLLMEIIELEHTVSLPCPVRMAIPKGATIIWVGEILGGDQSKDPQATYKVNNKADYDEVVFTLTQSRIGQVEVRLEENPTVNGTAREWDFAWTQRYETNSALYMFREPSGATDFKVEPVKTTMGTTSDGGRFYQTDPLSLAVGDTQNFKVTYNRSENAAKQDVKDTQAQQQEQQSGGTTGQSTGKSKGTDSLIVLAVAVAVIALGAFMYRANRMGNDASEDD